jgi:hypothetical protein
MAVNAVFLPNPPAVGVNAALGITPTGAMLSAVVNPIGSPTTVYFQWGLTDTYGNQTASQNLGNGLQAVADSADLTGLAPGTVYHYRVVATNGQGVTVGSDETFTTSGTGVPGMPPWALATLALLLFFAASAFLRSGQAKS